MSIVQKETVFYPLRQALHFLILIHAYINNFSLSSVTRESSLSPPPRKLGKYKPALMRNALS